MSKATTKKRTIERTYDLDPEGKRFVLDGKAKAGLTRRLRNDAKEEGLGDLGDTRILRIEEKIGRSVKITVSATEGEPTTDDTEPAEGDDLNAPAPTE